MWAKLKQKIRRVLPIAPTIAGLVIGVRMTGVLQLLELSAFDQLVRLRPVDKHDDRIVIVGIDEKDLRYVGDWPIPDGILAELLNKIKEQQPKAIGLDIYRDMPVNPGHEDLVNVFQTTKNLIGITKVVGGEQVNMIPPPPALKEQNQIGANDFPPDLDAKVRRAFLYLDDENQNITFSFGFKLAWMYLQDFDISPETNPKNPLHIHLGKTLLTPFSRNDGSYVWAEDEGYQIFLDYRGPNNSFKTVSLRDVLNDKISPSLMRDRIVLIGSTAVSVKDFLLTPYSSSIFDSTPTPMPGVEVHANMISQLISAALEGKSLLKTWPEALEWLWIFSWSLVGVTLTSKWRHNGNLNKLLIGQTSIRIPITCTCLILTCYIAFLLHWWIPLVTPLLTLIGSTIFTIGYTLWENLIFSHKQLEEYARNLEIKVDERTKELRDKNEQMEQANEQLEEANEQQEKANYQLQQTLQKLQSAQKQIVAQEKLAYLGSLTAGIAHEIRNPLNFINNFAQISGELTEELLEEFQEILNKNDKDILEAEDIEYIKDILSDLKNSVVDIESHGKRIETIIQSMMMHTSTQKGNREMTNLNALLSESIELAYNSHLAKENRETIIIENDYDRSLGEVDVIPQDMARAFVNIIKNACDAVNTRQKKVGDKFQPMISVKTLDRDETVKIYIRDNGIGIPSENLEKIFNPFFTTKDPGEGTGLGLSLSYDTIVGEHQGDIKVETEPEHYTEFIIVVPKKPWQNL